MKLTPIAMCALLAACGSSSSAGPDAAPDAPQLDTTGIIASGQLEVPAATSFEEPGFHEAFEVMHTLPVGLAPAAGTNLIIRLRDQGRPDQTCSQEHPLSGCATVDWSDAVGRPNVPEGGVFDNRITVQLASGPRDFYLTEARGLADVPDPYVPS